MPNYFNRVDKNKRDLFDAPNGEGINSTSLDLPTKLTMLFKRGFGQKYIAKPNKLDAPTVKKHQEYIKSQFSKATYDHYVRSTTLEIDRRKSFEDYTVMDYTPEISSALDIYADECLTSNENGDILTIRCENDRISKVLENLFYDILDINHNMWQWTRQMCKYGNHFLLLDVQPRLGVCGFLPIPTEEMRREEAYDGDINSVKFLWDAQNLVFDNWQVAHFRLLSDMRKFPYGTSQLESARLVWKQLQLAEDAMLIYRITRAPERRVFYIDVGNINPEDVGQYVSDIKNSIKRTPMVNEPTGNLDWKYNPMAMDEDFFIPRRNDKNSEIETLPGASNLDEIADIEYLQQKMFASLKIPKAYLTFDDQINAKATLSSEDFRFARTINRLQQAIISTLTNIAIIHLYSMGFRDRDQLTGFELRLTNPSTQTDIEKMEVLEQKSSVFNSLWNDSSLSPVSYVWAMQNIFDFNDEEIKKILNQQYLEGKMKLEIEKVSQPDMGDMEAGDQPADDGGEAEAESGFVDSEGNQLPSTPPEGKAYIDRETGEIVAEFSEPRKLNIDAMLRSISEKPAGANIENRCLIKNSLSYDNTMRMLENLDENIELNNKKLNELKFDDNK